MRISSSHRLCLVMPGIVQKIECIFGAATDQNYALRTLLTLQTGVFLLVAMLFASIPKKKAILVGLQCSGVSFALASYLAHFGVIHIPEGRFDPVMADRFCYLIGNPSWMAPLLAPSILAATALVFDSRRWRLLNLASILPMMDLILRSQQRGGLVVVLATVAYLLAFLLRAHLIKLSKLAIKFKKSFIVFLVAIITPIFFMAPILWSFFASSLEILGFGNRISSSGFVSGERLIIWRAAWSELQGHLLFGHGYASWYRAGALKVPNYGLNQHFDTAHNFFVQYLFEHGIVSFTVWIIACFLTSFSLWKCAKESHRWMLGLIAVIFFPLMLFQEIDFLRSGFYLSMVSIGAVISIAVDFEGRMETVRAVPRRLRNLAIFIGVSFIGLGFYFLSAFSLGGYQYEANAHHDYGPTVRWFRQKGQINFVRGSAKNREQFALYEVLKSSAHRLDLMGTHRDQPKIININLSDLAPTNSHHHFVPIAAKSFLDSADSYQLDKSEKTDGRQLGMMLSWPPVVTTMAVTHVFGGEAADYLPYTDQFGTGFWCGKSCEFKFLPCKDGQLRTVMLTVEPKYKKIKLNIEKRPDTIQEINVGAEPVLITLTAQDHLKLTAKSDIPEIVSDTHRQVFVYGGKCQ